MVVVPVGVWPKRSTPPGVIGGTDRGGDASSAYEKRGACGAYTMGGACVHVDTSASREEGGCVLVISTPSACTC